MMDPHPLREMISDHSCKNCRYPERGCTRYLRLETCEEFQPNDDATYREIVRLKIAHLRRMVDACSLLFSRAVETAERAPQWPPAERIIAINHRIRRFRAACLAKIAELKEMQCSTKS